MSGKLGLMTLSRPVRKTATRTFEDPVHPGKQLALTFRALDTVEQLSIQSRANKLIESLNGNYLPLGGGDSVPVTEEIAQHACMLELMQPESMPESERYTALEFVALAYVMPTAYADVLMWAADLAKQESERLGNSLIADGEQS